MTVILYHKAGRISAPRLAAYMGISARRHLKTTTDCLIRWGMGTAVPTPEREINSRKALTNYSGRYKQLQLLKAGNVSIPPFDIDPNAIKLPMLGRKERKGRQPMKGWGITFYRDEWPEYAKKDSFYTRFYPKQRQFRVHVVGDVTRTRELIPDAEKSREQPIWNYATGFTYRQAAAKRPMGVIPQAKLAIKALGLDFGAVDVITHDGEPYVLEVNTAPGLGDLTLAWYGCHLGKLAGISEMPGWAAVEKTYNEEV